MNVICVIVLLFSIASAMAAREDSRDWQAFLNFNTEINDWTASSDPAVKAEKINVIFFKFWLLYFGPDCYKDVEALGIRPFVEAKYRTIQKTIPLTGLDLFKGLEIPKANPTALVSESFAALGTFRIARSKTITVGELEKISDQFSRWKEDLSQNKPK